MRSAKIRTREKTVITVPNAEFAKLQLENLSRRTKTLFRHSLRIGVETTGDQLRYLLAKLTDMLIEHPELLEKDAEVRLVEVEADHLEVRIKAYAGTTDWPHFKIVRQDVLLRALAIVEEAGIALAIPPRVQYPAEAPRVSADNAREAQLRIAEWKQGGDSSLPESGPKG